MELLVCIDDTDNLESKGTGAIADELKEIIRLRGFGDCGPTTRHQLLLHEDIPYTSHNSAMCFTCMVDPGLVDTLIPVLYQHVQAESARGADPGIAIAKNDSSLDRESLIRFGYDAKRRLMTKAQAYSAAGSAGLYLAEAGGTGQGVIGALAGVGLRLSGNDGEVKGGVSGFLPDTVYSVAALLESKRFDAVCDPEGRELDPREGVLVAWKVKPLLLHHRFVLVVRQTGAAGALNATDRLPRWTTMVKNEMRDFGNEQMLKTACKQYTPDVEEEQVAAPMRSCLNCRFRRWLPKGFLCAADPSV